LISLPVLPSSSFTGDSTAGVTKVPRAGTGTRAAPRLVRLSITDRCDLACVYCRPHRRDGYLPAERRLRASHWATLVEGLVRRGVERVRITGGEPLVHPEVVDIVARIARIPGVRDLAITTNGTRLAELAAPLRAAGLHRVNLSLDSLHPERFWQLTRGGRLDDVLAGVEAARAVGFEELKINTVVVASDGPGGIGNDDELVAIARWAWSVDATPRFLELMSIGEGAQIRGRFVPYAAMRAALHELLDETPEVRPSDRGPARYARARDGSGRTIGFITGSSDTFCDGCDRLRATSDGTLRPCLATHDAIDVNAAIAAGDVEAIAEGLDEAWAKKPDGFVWKGCTEDTAASVSMRATGG
jgi:cyclic pyranopterin phosphate synthase